MDIGSRPPDDEPPRPNANVPNDDNVVSLESQEEKSCLSESSDGGSNTDDGSFSGMDLRKKISKSTTEVKRLNKIISVKKNFITRLKNQKSELVNRHAKQLAIGQAAQTNLKKTIQQERTTRAQIKASICNQYLEDIKSAKILEKTAKKAQTQAERKTNRTRFKFESLQDSTTETSMLVSKHHQDIVEGHRKKTPLKQLVKDQDKELKALRAKLIKYDMTTKGKQLEIENARTQRAMIDAEARKSKEKKEFVRLRQLTKAKSTYCMSIQN
jgi:chromosome segregation ATPase